MKEPPAITPACGHCLHAEPVSLPKQKRGLICKTNPAFDHTWHMVWSDGSCCAYRIDPRKNLTGTMRIPLTRGRFTLVDADDYWRFSSFKFCLQHTQKIPYASARVRGPRRFLHRLIMSPRPGRMVDHINHDGLDNRKANLRCCTRQQNGFNRRPLKNTSSKYKGVRRDKRNNKWIAAIRLNYKRTIIGAFDDEIDAAKAYDQHAKKTFGPFAYLNFPDSDAP